MSKPNLSEVPDGALLEELYHRAIAELAKQMGGSPSGPADRPTVVDPETTAIRRELEDAINALGTPEERAELNAKLHAAHQQRLKARREARAAKSRKARRASLKATKDVRTPDPVRQTWAEENAAKRRSGGP